MDKFKLNKILVWSIANVLVGVCGIIVAYTGDMNAVLILGGVTGEIFLANFQETYKGLSSTRAIVSFNNPKQSQLF